jgi:hypothetical protein
MIAEEHVAVIHHAIDRDDVERADAAFAAPAIGNHADAGVFQGIQDGLCFRHHDLAAAICDPQAKRLGGKRAAGAEGLEALVRMRPAEFAPDAPGVIKQGQGTADRGDAAGRERRQCRTKIEPLPLA